MSDIVDIFIGETREHLELLNESLLRLEQTPEAQEVIHEIFRVTHTIKGSAAMMGLGKMSRLAHGMEDVFHDIRDGQRKADTRLIEILFVGCDMLEKLLNSMTQTGAEGDFEIEMILDQLHRMIETSDQSSITATESEALQSSLPGSSGENAEQTSARECQCRNLYLLGIRFQPESPYKSARALVIYRKLAENGQIINVNPDLRTIKETELEPEYLKLMLASWLSMEELRKLVEEETDVEPPLLIETLECSRMRYAQNEPVIIALPKIQNSPSESPLKTIVEQIIDDDRQQVVEIEPILFDNFINETRRHIGKIEYDLLEWETNRENHDTSQRLFRYFHAIRRAACFTGFDIIRRIALVTGTFLSKIGKKEIQVGQSVIDLIVGSAELIKKVTEDFRLQMDRGFMAEVEVHLSSFGGKKLEQILLAEQSSDEVVAGQLKVYRLGEILVKEDKLTPSNLEALLHKQQQDPSLKLGQLAVKEGIVKPADIISSIRIQEEIKTNFHNEVDFLRIPTMKVDNLVDLVGELLILHSQIEQDAVNSHHSTEKTLFHISRMERIIKEVHNQSMALRMVSLKPTFTKINRVARDTIRELGKDVNFIARGEETEIDRGVVDKLQDPLLHTVKNAISHGIEPEPERIALGKPAQGQVAISAYHSKGNIFIEVSDDGRGLSLEKIYQKAVEKGLADTSRSYKDEEIIDFIFLPGFSTMETVNQISGRGVGLDVVRTEIMKVGGKIEIDNQPGKGCTFRLKIPLNFTAMNGMIVTISGGRYIVPTLHIKEIIQPEAKNWIEVKGVKGMYRLRDKLYPMIPIRDIFGLPGQGDDESENRVLLLVEYEKNYRLLPVAEIVGRKEIVVKPLTEEFKDLGYASSVAILGDGKASLIFDVQYLFQRGSDLYNGRTD